VTLHRLVGLIALCGVLWPAMPQAQTTFTPDEARLKAAQLLSSGQPEAARDILVVLVERDPEDAASQILLAQAHRRSGELKQSLTASRAAWRHADQDFEKYAAALARAQALSQSDRKSEAQLWLRRAAHVAPNDALRAKAVRDYRFVQRTNPISVNLRFGLTPSDNVNNAPRDNTVVLGGLVFVDDSAVPLSGIEAEFGADLRYNFNISQTRRDFVAVSWEHTRIKITDDNVPASVDEDGFNYSKLEASVGRDLQSGRDKPRHTVALSLGRIWSGGSHLSDEARLRYSQSHAFSGSRFLTVQGSVGYADRKDKDIRSGTTMSLNASWSVPVVKDSRLSLSAGVSRTDTDSASLTHTELIYGATYTLGQPVVGAVTSLSVFANARRYDDAVFGADPRDDDGYVFSSSLLFKDFDTHGFAPKVTLSLRRTNSNIARFETENIGVSIGFQSVF
jgi:tetratricopeptide (TPR) repeat protein